MKRTPPHPRFAHLLPASGEKGSIGLHHGITHPTASLGLRLAKHSTVGVGLHPAKHPATLPRPAKRGEGGPERSEGPDEGLARLAVIAILILAPVVASACPVCYGNAQTPLTKSASNGVLFLLGIVGSVQVGFVALFFSFWKRAKSLQQKREQFHIIDGGKSQ
jgi:hypothetical protein